MANILFSNFTPIMENGEYKNISFYEGIINALTRNGNNVMHLISSDFMPTPWNGDNNSFKGIKQQKIFQQINEFKPDLCLAFNNSIPQFISNKLECPIILWHSDTYKYFNGKSIIESNPNRYYYVCPFEEDVVNIKNLGVKEKNIIQILPATDIFAENIEYQNNIVFIGSTFKREGLNQFIKAHGFNEDLKLLLLSLKHNEQEYYNNFLKKYRLTGLEGLNASEYTESLNSVHFRVSVLALLSELGLELYGDPRWIDLAEFLPWLAMSYNNKKVYSLEHLSNIYNSSKLCVSISHAQAKSGFPWRVMDIMASKGCLLTDKKSGIADFTAGYVDIPVYETPSQAYILAEKLLKDDLWRNDIILASQKCIEEKGRWEHRFKVIEDQLNIKLINKSSKTGVNVRLMPQDFIKGNHMINPAKLGKQNIKKQIRNYIPPRFYAAARMLIKGY